MIPEKYSRRTNQIVSNDREENFPFKNVHINFPEGRIQTITLIKAIEKADQEGRLWVWSGDQAGKEDHR